MLKSPINKQHLTPLVLLFIILFVTALANFIDPGEGWGYIAGFTFLIGGLIFLAVHIILCLVTSNLKFIWTVETIITIICLVYAYYNGILE